MAELFFCEALVHISALRIVILGARGRAAAATTRYGTRLELICEWESEDGQMKIACVPLPFCALDRTVPIQAVSHKDHVEVKLRLLDVGLDLQQTVPTPLENVASDVQVLASAIGVENENANCSTSFSCRACGIRVTTGQFRLVHELPSVDWRDLADHWFGICCCGPNIRTESIVQRFEQNVNPSPGKLLIGSTTCVVHFQNLYEAAVEVPECCSSYSDDDQKLPADEALEQAIEGEEGAETCTVDGHCGGGADGFRTSRPSSFYDFLRGPVQPTGSGNWTPSHCRSCGAVIGAYVRGSSTRVAAAHLFKRHISSSASPGTFRHHTLHRDFVEELRARIEHDSCYRFILRGLCSKKPMVQLVVTNETSLVSFGSLNGDSPLVNDGMKAALRFMFSDCRESTTSELRCLEEWGAEQRADEMFMLEEEIAVLVDEMCANQRFFPEVYTVVQTKLMSLRPSFLIA